MNNNLLTKWLFPTLIISTMIACLLSPSEASAGQTVLFEDNFDDGDASGWEQYGKSDGWTVVDGKYTGTVEPSSEIEATTLAGNLNWSDYSYEVDVTGLSGPDRSVLFRYNESRFPKGYEIKYVEGNYYSPNIILQKEGVGILGISYDINSNLSDTHKLRVEGEGNNIKVYFDDNLVIDVVDNESPLLTGKIGLYVQISGAGVVNQTAYDNVRVTSLNPTYNFDLPINYTGRPTATSQQFKSAFWKRLTAAFDHVLKAGTFRPFTGTIYSLRNCRAGTAGISCYDSHNGTDFSKRGGKDVLSVGEGTVVFTSEHTRRSCTPNRGGFGCVVIVEYPDNIFGLYAHLGKISVNKDDEVNVNSVLGIMGNTGCPTCGVHLHFGVLKPTGLATVLETKKGYIASRMGKSDWNDLLYQVRPYQTPTPFGPVFPNIPTFRPSCTYRAPNGQRFSFRDPSGWKGSDIDPWSKPTSKGGCEAESPYLWKFDVATGP